MTIGEAIDRADYICENAYDDKTKREWLSHLDGLIAKNILGTEFNGYSDATPPDEELLVEHPFDEIYVHWLLSKIHLANQELEQYNNAATVYGEWYQNFARHHQRTVGSGKKVRFINYRE